MQEDELELDIDELSNEVLHKLLAFVRKYAPRPDDSPPRQAATSAPSAAARPKKNKPMSKHEQEAQIEQVRGKLSAFQNPGSDEAPETCTLQLPDEARQHDTDCFTDSGMVPANDTSGDEDDSEESEEE